VLQPSCEQVLHMIDPRGHYNEATSWELDADEKRLGRGWLGYGSFAAPYWFIGLEPGGEYDPMFARYWITHLDSAAVFDPRRDDCSGPNPWFLPTGHSQPTWAPLIETVLGRTGSAEDVLDYQLRRFGHEPPVGEIATLELSAFAAKGIASPSPHRFTFLEERVVEIRNALRLREPEFAVFYGTSQRAAYDKIVDGFGTDGFKTVGRTICALVRHPAARGPRNDWRAFGRELRDRGNPESK
jgi:hypothetical protein